jgi:hypothetical protein
MTSDPAVDDMAPLARALRVLALIAASLVFGVLVTANSAGYRYGISDQSFYIPAFEHRADPALFPRDGDMIDAQSRLTVADELVGGLTASTGIPLPPLFLAGYLLTVVLFVAAIAGLGSRLYTSPWSVLALGLALTLRHRIAKTGVNTFEGYFHPRVLTFAIGLLALAALMRSQRRLAVAFVALGIIVHPTTGVWFATWVAVAMVASRPLKWKTAAAGVVAAAVLGGAFVLAGPLQAGLTVVDPAWAAVLAERDYLYPTEWAAETWLVNAIAPVILLLVYRWRRSLGLVTPVERGVVVGAFALLLVFAASLPFIAARIALAIQLQTSRVLWQVEVLALAYLVWALSEAPWGQWLTPQRRRAAVVAALLVASVARGAYILRVEHDHSLVVADLPETPWLRAADWIEANTPADTHVLADPDHAWRYGVSFRIAGRRDIFLERAKDAAIAIYSRPLAMQIEERRTALGDFYDLTPGELASLDQRYDLDYLITEQRLPLPLARSEGPLNIYRLDARP